MSGRALRVSCSADSVRILAKILYWAAVLAISIGLLIALVLFFESRDSSQLNNVILLPRP
jgi:hypothetical protein